MINETNEPSPPNSFEAMAEEFARSVRNGETPDIERYAQRNPELAARVRRLFPVLELLEQNGPATAWSEMDLLDAEQRQLELGGEQWVAPKKLGDFRLIREIGRGGMGIVYEAEQESLGRRVAIKILPASAQFDERRMERFATEAKASAMLHHTNIVPVFGIGREQGLSFIVMQFIAGQPLDLVLEDVSRIRDHSTKQLNEGESNLSNPRIVQSMLGETIERHAATHCEIEPERKSAVDDVFSIGSEPAGQHPSLAFEPDSAERASRWESGLGSDSGPILQPGRRDSSAIKVRNYFHNVARVGIKVSEALTHAHSHGILHRDIKPSNLLLDEHGAVWVTDFGLAKYFDSPDITRTGEVVGTLRYLSPEQLEGNAAKASDIFGLGLTIYEMLTLQPAYPGIDKKRLLEKVTEANPVVPRSIDSRIPRDLETIVMKCLHSEPSKRYLSAAEVGDDLLRFLNGQPILARRIGVAEKAWKWCCRRPTLAAMIAALAASILMGIAGVGWQWSKTSAALSVSQANFEKAKAATLRAKENSSKAERHFGQARSAVVQIMDSISNEELLTSPDLLPVRRTLLLKALSLQREFVRSHPGNVDVEVELADALLNLAAVSKELPKASEAKESLSEAKDILESLYNRDLDRSKREKVLIGMAEAYSLAGQIEMRDSHDGTLDVMEGVKILLDGRPEEQLSIKERIKLAELHRSLADTYTDQNISRPHPLRELSEKARAHYSKALELTKIALAADESNSRFAQLIAGDHRSLGVAHRRLKNRQVAFEHLVAAVDQFDELVASEPENTDFRYGLAISLSSLAFYYTYAEEDTETALAYYHDSIEEHRKLSEAYPTVLKFISGETQSTRNCCLLYERVKRSRKARPLRERTIELAKKALMFAPNDPQLLSNYGRALAGIGVNAKNLGERELAWKYQCEAREQQEKAMQLAPLNPTYQVRRCQVIVNLYFMLRSRKDFEGARLLMLEAIDQDQIDDDVLYITGRAMIQLARRIEYFTEDVSATDLVVADKAMNSAREVFSRLKGSRQAICDRIRADVKLRGFASSEDGEVFLDWFSSLKGQLAEKDKTIEKRDASAEQR